MLLGWCLVELDECDILHSDLRFLWYHAADSHLRVECHWMPLLVCWIFLFTGHIGTLVSNYQRAALGTETFFPVQALYFHQTVL